MTHKSLLRSHLLMLLLILSVGLIKIYWGEKIPVGGGFGWDGKFYGELAQDFWIRGMDTYRMQRIVPSAIIHYTLRALQAPLDNGSIIKAFDIYNLFLLLFGSYLWKLIADEMSLSVRGRWLGFTGLFVNFATLKQAFYYPVLTDVTAFVIGMLMLLFFLKGQSLPLFLATLIGAFTWPVILYGGIVLLLLPNKPLEFPTNNRLRLSLMAAMLPTALLAAFIIYFYYFKGATVYGNTYPVVQSVAPVSIAATLLFVFLTNKTLFDGVSVASFRESAARIPSANVVLAALVLLIAKAIPFAFGDHSQPIFTAGEFLEYISLNSITRPLVFLVAHVVFFGPVIILLFLLWKPFCRTLRQYGLGLLLFIALNVFISISPESRQVIHALPFFVAFLVKATEGLVLGSSFYWLIGVVSLVFSKFWFKINVAPMEGSELEFPLQYYFMHQGAYMSNIPFIVQGIVVLLTGLLFNWLIPICSEKRDG
ncbi:MAG: hypothetical protein LC778_09685, partial [Acidobacteria bacterium]|nr:hypothetical protein [Acidobacteriota bacterium]